MKYAFVTGASGFVGKALVRELLSHNIEVYAFMRKGSAQRYIEHPLLHVIAGDMDDIATLTHQTFPNIDVFYHLAWSGVAGTERSRPELQLQNAQWTVDALRTAKVLGCRRFLCTGSIMEYEALNETYMHGVCRGNGCVYGGGKVAAHIMCMRLAEELGIEFIWPIITNAYGPGEYSLRLVSSTVQKCIRKEPPRFTSGTQNYDFVYIDDVAQALRLIGEKGKPFHEYLIGSSQARTLKEFLLEMQAEIAPDICFQFGDLPYKGINLPLERFDCSVTERDTGFRAKVSFAEGCRRTMVWWKKQGIKEAGGS